MGRLPCGLVAVHRGCWAAGAVCAGAVGRVVRAAAGSERGGAWLGGAAEMGAVRRGWVFVHPSGGLAWWFQSPPPRRGACDSPKSKKCSPGGCPGFNPLRRGGGRATDANVSLYPTPSPHVVSIPSAEAGGVRRMAVRRCRAVWAPQVSIPSAEAGGVRPAPPAPIPQRRLLATFQSPPPRRGACDDGDEEDCCRRRPRGFQSPPPRRGACDSVTTSSPHGPAKRRSFNPLRRGGGRATA
jgi:hypothetical protein